MCVAPPWRKEPIHLWIEPSWLLHTWGFGSGDGPDCISLHFFVASWFRYPNTPKRVIQVQRKPFNGQRKRNWTPLGRLGGVKVTGGRGVGRSWWTDGEQGCFFWTRSFYIILTQTLCAHDTLQDRKQKSSALCLDVCTTDEHFRNDSKTRAVITDPRAIHKPGWYWAAWWAASGRRVEAESAAAPVVAAEADHTQRWRWSGDPHLSRSLL